MPTHPKHMEEMKSANASSNDLLIEENKIEKLKHQRDLLKETIADIKKNEKDKRLRKSYDMN